MLLEILLRHMKILLFIVSVSIGFSFCAYSQETVILLHGLVRSPHSMNKMEKRLKKEGYEVANIGYPSTKHGIEELSAIVREKIVSNTVDATTVHFVTHSMGGILLRYIQEYDPMENIGRVIMLSPPNQGSEVVDKLGDYKMFKWINGPAGLQLGTGEGNFIAKLKPVNFELGVITGDRSINWILSSLIKGTDDGKVSIEQAQVDGMNEFKVVHATHPFIMKNKQVIESVIMFLKTGSFETKE